MKPTNDYTPSFKGALPKLRTYKVAGWRDYGAGNSQSARKAISWVTEKGANRLLEEQDDLKRVAIYESLTDFVE